MTINDIEMLDDVIKNINIILSRLQAKLNIIRNDVQQAKFTSSDNKTIVTFIAKQVAMWITHKPKSTM